MESARSEKCRAEDKATYFIYANYFLHRFSAGRRWSDRRPLTVQRENRPQPAVENGDRLGAGVGPRRSRAIASGPPRRRCRVARVEALRVPGKCRGHPLPGASLRSPPTSAPRPHTPRLVGRACSTQCATRHQVHCCTSASVIRLREFQGSSGSAECRSPRQLVGTEFSCATRRHTGETPRRTRAR